MDITGSEILRLLSLRTAPKSSRAADVSVYAMTCPRCGAGPGRSCRRHDRTAMSRAHSERNQKLFHATRALDSDVIAGFVTAGIANGDFVTLTGHRMEKTVLVSGVEGVIVARANDTSLDLSAVLLLTRSGSLVVMQVRSEDIIPH